MAFSHGAQPRAVPEEEGTRPSDISQDGYG